MAPIKMRWSLLLSLALLMPSLAWAGTTFRTPSGSVNHWSTPQVVVTVDPQHPSSQFDEETVERALKGALDSWSTVPEAPIWLTQEPPQGSVRGRVGRALVRFRQEGWPASPDKLAKTELDTDPQTGVIRTAIIEINEESQKFFVRVDGVKPPRRTYDLQAVLTHEIGHLLGLDHSADVDAVMYHITPPGLAAPLAPNVDDRTTLASIYGHRSQQAPLVAQNIITTIREIPARPPEPSRSAEPRDLLDGRETARQGTDTVRTCTQPVAKGSFRAYIIGPCTAAADR